jgi:hypothetical protein
MSHKNLIQTNEDGIVEKTITNVEPYNYVTDQYLYPTDPVLIDNDLASVYYSRLRVEDGIATDESVLIHPYTEQVLDGMIYGGFKLNEQVYQTPVNVEVVNFLSINGVTAFPFTPVIGSIGVSSIHERHSAKFFGTVNDLPGGKGAGLRLPPFNSQPYSYFSIEGFVYFESLPTAYDPILVSRGLDDVGGTTQDSFQIEYDAASRRLMLNYTMGAAAGGSTASGYENYLPISPIDGVTTNQWHHFACSVAVAEGSSAWNVFVGTFFDGTRIGYEEYEFYDPIAETGIPQPSTFESTFRASTAPLMIGCGHLGDRPLKGWLDSILISAGRSPTALRGYDPTLTSVVVPTKRQMVAGEFTVYHLNMNGPLGTSFFPCDTPCRVVSTATYISNDQGKLGTGLITRQTSEAPPEFVLVGLSPWHGFPLFEGVCYGHAPTGFLSSPCFGATSRSCMIVIGVTQLHEITRANKIRANAAQFTASYLLGSTAMSGSITAQDYGDFRRLFSEDWGGNTFTYLATQTNTINLNFTYDSIEISEREGPFYISDYVTGAVYGVQTGDIKNLYADVVEYHSLVNRLGASAAATALGFTDFESLYNYGGFGEEAIVRRIAPRMDDVGILFITGNGRMSKLTTRPELVTSPYVTVGLFAPVSNIPGTFESWYPNLYPVPY